MCGDSQLLGGRRAERGSARSSALVAKLLPNAVEGAVAVTFHEAFASAKRAQVRQQRVVVVSEAGERESVPTSCQRCGSGP